MLDEYKTNAILKGHFFPDIEKLAKSKKVYAFDGLCNKGYKAENQNETVNLSVKG